MTPLSSSDIVQSKSHPRVCVCESVTHIAGTCKKNILKAECVTDDDWMVLSVPGVRRVSRAEPKGGRGQALSRHVSQRDERLPGQSVGDQLLLGRPGGGLRKPSGE